MTMSRRSIAASGLGSAVMLAAPRIVLPAPAADEQTPAEAVEAFRQAMLAGDHAAFDALCAAQLSYGRSTRAIQTKEGSSTPLSAGSSNGRRSNCPREKHGGRPERDLPLHIQPRGGDRRQARACNRRTNGAAETGRRLEAASRQGFKGWRI